VVARKAGVSPSTVSRILNGTARVSEAKKQAVERVVARLGFRPNPVARGLAGGRTMSIGVITQAVDGPFYGEGMRGIEDTLAPAGYMPLFVSGDWRLSQEERCIEALISRRVDGIIVLAGRISDRALQVLARTVPVVVIGRSIQGPQLIGLPFDNVEGGRLATQHLIECGHTKIAFITGDPKHKDALDRQRGYRDALDRASIPFDPTLVITGDYHEASGLQAVNQLLDSRQDFSAIFAANDQTAVGAILGLHRKGLRVPDDISVIGFDDVSFAKYWIPPLSTIRYPIYELGCQAASCLSGLLGGAPAPVAVPAPQLVSRESTQRLRR
jgi:LacI family transcriptional regulator